MAKNEVTVNVAADTRAFDRALETLSGKLSNLFSANAFTLEELSPWKILGDQVKRFAQMAVESFRDYGKNVSAIGEETRRQAAAINAAAGEFVRLQDAAERAGVGAQAFADAMDDIKAGRTDIEAVADAWERIARTDKVGGRARERALAMLHAPGEAMAEAKRGVGFWATVFGEATAAERLAEMLRAMPGDGRRDAYTAAEVLRGRSGFGLTKWAETIAMTLNDELWARQERAQKRLEADNAARWKADREAATAASKAAEAQANAAYAAEDKARAEEAAAEAKAQAGVDATARKVAGDYARLTKSGSTPAEAIAVLAEAYGTTPDAIGRALARGQALLRDPVAEAIARNEEKAAAEAEAKAEREELLARRQDARERVAGLRDALARTGGDLTAQLFGAAGGSLVGAGSFTLAMAERLRAIDRAERQEAIVDRLDKAIERLDAIEAALAE